MATRDPLGDFLPELKTSDALPAPRLPRADAAISIAELQAKSVPMEWYEAVAITQAMCDTLCESGDQRAAIEIRPESVYVTAAGAVGVMPMRSPKAPDAMRQVSDLLHQLLEGKSVPTPLRLALSTSVSGSLEEWSKMLAYYERPNRIDLIKGVYERAVTISASATAYTRPVSSAPVAEMREAPPTPAVTPPKRRESPAVSKRVVMTSAAVAVASAVAIAAWMIGPHLTDTFRFPQMSGSPAAGEAADATGAAAESVPTTRAARAPARTTTPPAQVPGSVADAEAGTLSTLQPSDRSMPLSTGPVGVSGIERRGVEAMPLTDESIIYSRDDQDVVPPSAIYPNFPSRLPAGVRPDEVAEFYVVVSETGTVESVRARRVPETMAEAMTMTMSLSAAKAWRFRPGSKNGHPVRYRTIVWVMKG